jgi:mono/diheme cytochrome c family protein
VKFGTLALAVLLVTAHAWGQSGEMRNDETAAKPAPAKADIVPLPSIKSLTSAQAAGKKLFVQRCAVCHLPALPSYTTYGPLLSGSLIASFGEDAVREQIKNGSMRMPGYQYTLSAQEIDQVVGYLKILEYRKKD